MFTRKMFDIGKYTIENQHPQLYISPEAMKDIKRWAIRDYIKCDNKYYIIHHDYSYSEETDNFLPCYNQVDNIEEYIKKLKLEQL